MHRLRCLVRGGWLRTCTVLLLIVAGLAACESDLSKLREPGTEAATEMTETPVPAMATATATQNPMAQVVAIQHQPLLATITNVYIQCALENVMVVHVPQIIAMKVAKHMRSVLLILNEL